jgi:hypothetical protein
VGHILFCGVNFDQRPQGINSGRLARALMAQGTQVSVVCGRQKSSPSIDDLDVRSVSIAPRHPRALWNAYASLRGDHPCNHYWWTRRVSALALDRMPDVVYGRAWPYSSLVGAAALAKRIDRPLWLHFSDPFPAPPKVRERDHVMQGLREIAGQAVGATFTNAEEAAYQVRHLPGVSNDWAHVLNHIAPPPQTFGPSESGLLFAYIGAFSASRPADTLLAGFAKYLETVSGATLHCVGTKPARVVPIAESLRISGQVRVEPFTRDIATWQRKASVLVAVDWLSGEPVYLLTKIVESFVVDRPVLLLTQRNSPGFKLAAHCPDSVVCVTSTDPDAVAQGFEAAAAIARRGADYASRQRLMEPFSAENVATRCAQLLLGR